MKIESKIGKISYSAEIIYNFLSDFNHFKNFIPADKVSDFQSTADTCSFSVPGMGTAGLKIIDRQPWKLLKICNDENTSINFFLWIQIKELAINDSRIKITIQPEVNQMMQMMVKKPLKNFVDNLVEKMETFPFA